MIITRAELAAMTREEYEAWQYTPEEVRLMPGPWSHSDGSPFGDNDTPSPNDYMWTGHTNITSRDEIVAGVVAKNRGIIAPAIRAVETTDSEGVVRVDWSELRRELLRDPRVKAAVDAAIADADVVLEPVLEGAVTVAART